MEENFQVQKTKRNLPRDVFLHLLAIFTLYWSAVSFITLLWQYVNYFFPDVLRYYADYTWPIRFAVSSLFIVFPIFILVSWYLNKIYMRESEVRESKVRKWLIYLTLFIASLVIIGDLVSIINTFLGGEIKARFILKALSVLFVAGLIFGYYLDDVRKPTPSKSAKYFAMGTALVILISVIGAFFIIGTPATARLLQLDQQRIYDLQSIQGQIVNYWQRKEQLPQNLSDLEEPISGYQLPVDPETKSPYVYNVKDAEVLKFELCATFSLESEKTATPRLIYDSFSQNWAHSAGYVCFERTIDRQLYPPYPKPAK